jgi:hypothetical protein
LRLACPIFSRKPLTLLMQKLALFLFLACLSPVVVGKSFTLPADTINNNQIYLNKKPLLFANVHTKETELRISLKKKKLKSTDVLEAAYSSCTRSLEKYQLSLKDTKGNTIWETSTQTHIRTQIPASFLLKSKEKERYLCPIIYARATLLE